MISMKRTICALSLLLACSSSGVTSTTGSRANDASAPILVVSHDGAAGTKSGSSPFGQGTSCPQAGQTRSCCDGRGSQACMGTAEFLSWGGCLDKAGAAVSCIPTQTSACGQGEFAMKCQDSGVTHHCGEGEFGPDCSMPALCTDRDINNEPEILAA